MKNMKVISNLNKDPSEVVIFIIVSRFSYQEVMIAKSSYGITIQSDVYSIYWDILTTFEQCNFIVK